MFLKEIQIAVLFYFNNKSKKLIKNPLLKPKWTYNKNKLKKDDIIQGWTCNNLVSEYQQYQDATAEEEGEMDEKDRVIEQNRKFHHKENIYPLASCRNLDLEICMMLMNISSRKDWSLQRDLYSIHFAQNRSGGNASASYPLKVFFIHH